MTRCSGKTTLSQTARVVRPNHSDSAASLFRYPKPCPKSAAGSLCGAGCQTDGAASVTRGCANCRRRRQSRAGVGRSLPHASPSPCCGVSGALDACPAVRQRDFPSRAFQMPSTPTLFCSRIRYRIQKYYVGQLLRSNSPSRVFERTAGYYVATDVSFAVFPHHRPRPSQACWQNRTQQAASAWHEATNNPGSLHKTPPQDWISGVSEAQPRSS